MKLVAALITALGTLVLAGCTEDGNEWQRLVCEVHSINGGASLLSGYVDIGSPTNDQDDTYPVDIVEVVFHARPYNRSVVLPEDAPYSYFHVTSYDLIWHPMTPGSEPLVDYNLTGAGTDVLVPVNDEGAGAVLVADRYLKEQAWFIAQVSSEPMTARCELRFHGHETGSTREVTVVGSFMVNFVYAIADN
jgi:hypothetical protein